MAANWLTSWLLLIFMGVCVTGIDVNKIRDQAIGLRTMLENYYGKNKIILTNTLSYRPGMPDYEKGVEQIAQKMVRKILLNEKVVIATMGSSVVAGHDNCMYDSYTSQLERLVGPIFDLASGIEIRNAGITGSCGDNHKNNIYCIRHLLGDNVDIAHYEWTYMERPEGSGPEHEMFIRWAMMRGAVGHLFTVAGKEKGEYACKISVERRKPDGTLFSQYGKFGNNFVCMGWGVKQLGYRFVWGAIGDGLHNTTRYGESEENPKRRDSLGVVYRNWHPGPLAFQLLSDVFGYYYMEALLKALDIIDQQGNVNLLEMIEESSPSIDVGHLPIPIYCDPNACNQLPNCLDMEFPTFGKSLITIVQPSDESNPYLDRVSPTDLGWGETADAPDQRLWGPSEERGLSICPHTDHCAALEGGKSAGWLTFSLPPLSTGNIIICRLKHGPEFDISKTEALLNGVALQNGGNLEYTKCMYLQKGWNNGIAVKGPLFLGLRIQAAIQISHIIAY